MIPFSDFAKIELKVGTVLEAEELLESEKLIRLKVDLGPSDVIPAKAGIHINNLSDGSVPAQAGIGSGMTKEDRDIRQVLAGIKQWYKAKDLVGKQVVVVANLEPRMMMGLESQGMILCADFNKPVLLKPSQKVPPGTKVR